MSAIFIGSISRRDHTLNHFYVLFIGCPSNSGITISWLHWHTRHELQRRTTQSLKYRVLRHKMCSRNFEVCCTILRIHSKRVVVLSFAACAQVSLVPINMTSDLSALKSSSFSSNHTWTALKQHSSFRRSAVIDEAFIDRNSWVSSVYWWWSTPCFLSEHQRVKRKQQIVTDQRLIHGELLSYTIRYQNNNYWPNFK